MAVWFIPIISAALTGFNLADIGLYFGTGRGVIDWILGTPSDSELSYVLGMSLSEFLMSSMIPLSVLVVVLLMCVWYAFLPIRGGGRRAR